MANIVWPEGVGVYVALLGGCNAIRVTSVFWEMFGDSGCVAGR